MGICLFDFKKTKPIRDLFLKQVVPRNMTVGE